MMLRKSVRQKKDQLSRSYYEKVAAIKVFNEQLQVSELNLPPPPELQFNVGLLSEVDEIFSAFYQNSPFIEIT